MGGHPQQGTDGHHPGAPHPGDQDVIGFGSGGQPGLGQILKAGMALAGLGLAQSSPMDGDKAGAEAVDTGVVLVTGGLVDLPLAAKGGFLGDDRQTVGFDRAVPTTLTDGFVDKYPLRGVGDDLLLAPAALLGGTGLVVDDHRGAGYLPQFPLDLVQFIPVVEGGIPGEQGTIRVLVGLVGDHGDTADTLAIELMADLGHRQDPIHRLASGHGHGIVIEDLIGDIDLGGDGRPDGQ